jgi:hypothetical protein
MNCYLKQTQSNPTRGELVESTCSELVEPILSAVGGIENPVSRFLQINRNAAGLEVFLHLCYCVISEVSD